MSFTYFYLTPGGPATRVFELAPIGTEAEDPPGHLVRRIFPKWKSGGFGLLFVKQNRLFLAQYHFIADNTFPNVLEGR